jgi:hypothetical protein
MWPLVRNAVNTELYLDGDGRKPPCVEVAPARVARDVLVRAVFVTVVHSMGTVAGILDPPDEFRVTEKANG